MNLALLAKLLALATVLVKLLWPLIVTAAFTILYWTDLRSRLVFVCLGTLICLGVDSVFSRLCPWLAVHLTHDGNVSRMIILTIPVRIVVGMVVLFFVARELCKRAEKT